MIIKSVRAVFLLALTCSNIVPSLGSVQLDKKGETALCQKTKGKSSKQKVLKKQKETENSNPKVSKLKQGLLCGALAFPLIMLTKSVVGSLSTPAGQSFANVEYSDQRVLVPNADAGIIPYIPLFAPQSQTGRFLRSHGHNVNQFYVQPILKNPGFVPVFSNRDNPQMKEMLVPGAQVVDVLSLGKFGFYREFAQYWNDGSMGEMLERFAQSENAHLESHFVFYHGQNNVIMAYQDLIKAKLQIRHPEIGDPDIRVFRVPSDNLSRVSNIMSVYQTVNDKSTVDGQIKQFFLSGSENIFAGTFGFYDTLMFNSASESALSYFFKASTAGGSMFLGGQNNVMKEIYDFFQVPEPKRVALTREFNQIVEDYNLANTQSLLQIFIPKDIVNELVYFARPTGVMIRFNDGITVRDYLERPSLDMLSNWQFDMIASNIHDMTKSPYIQNECRISLTAAPQVRILLKNEYFLQRRAGTANIEVKLCIRDRTMHNERYAAYLGAINRLAQQLTQGD